MMTKMTVVGKKTGVIFPNPYKNQTKQKLQYLFIEKTRDQGREP
jgi:hypothetical protein